MITHKHGDVIVCVETDGELRRVYCPCCGYEIAAISRRGRNYWQAHFDGRYSEEYAEEEFDYAVAWVCEKMTSDWKRKLALAEHFVRGSWTWTPEPKDVADNSLLYKVGEYKFLSGESQGEHPTPPTKRRFKNDDLRRSKRASGRPL